PCERGFSPSIEPCSHPGNFGSATSQSIIQDLDLILFALAGCLGVGASIFVSAHIVRALRRLAEGTAAVQAGHFAVTVPVETDDEVGQLAIAFNRMVEEIHTREKIKDAFGKFLFATRVAAAVLLIAHRLAFYWRSAITGLCCSGKLDIIPSRESHSSGMVRSFFD